MQWDTSNLISCVTVCVVKAHVGVCSMCVAWAQMLMTLRQHVLLVNGWDQGIYVWIQALKLTYIIKTDRQQAKQAPDFKPIRPTAEARKINTQYNCCTATEISEMYSKRKNQEMITCSTWMDGWASNEAPNQWDQSVWLGDPHTAQVGCIINRTNQDWLRYSMCWWKEMSAVVHPLKTQETTKQRHGSQTIGAPWREKQQQTRPQISCLSSR